MRDLRAILTLEPVVAEFAGAQFKLSRPTVVDLIELTDENAKDPVRAKLHALARHVLDMDGNRVFQDIDAAACAPAGFATAVIPMIERLYSEGLD